MLQFFVDLLHVAKTFHAFNVRSMWFITESTNQIQEKGNPDHLTKNPSWKIEHYNQGHTNDENNEKHQVQKQSAAVDLFRLPDCAL